VRDCKAHEEEEGRINCDMLNRLVIVGGQLVQNSQDMQGLLVGKVRFQHQIICLNFQSSFHSSRPLQSLFVNIHPSYSFLSVR
jgi:hypothetical protein